MEAVFLNSFKIENMQYLIKKKEKMVSMANTSVWIFMDWFVVDKAW